MLISPIKISPLAQRGGVDFTNSKSLYLDGVDETVNIDSVYTALASTTVGTWSILVKPVDATPTSNERLINFGDTNANEFIATWIDSTGKLKIALGTSGVVKFNLTTDAAAFSNNTWTHVAIVQDGISPKIYINSVLVPQTFNISTDKTVWFNNLTGLDNGRIGTLNYNSLGETGHFNGNVDEVLFVNRALTQPQISDIYNAGSPKDESSISNGVTFLRMGDKGTYTTEWTFPDQIGSNNATTVNCELADVQQYMPLAINGLQLYLAKNNATPSSWLDKSPNAFNFAQATGTKQPTISANSVDFDGVDDVQQVIGSSLLNDSSGIIFFSGYYDNTSNNRILASADVLTNNDLFHVQIQASTGRVRLVIIQGGVNRIISVTNPITNGAYYYGYIESNDTSYTMSLNGVVETLIVVV